MNKKEFEKEFAEKQQRAQLEALDSNRCRAQAVSIGMSASGTTEITMRGVNGSFLWEIYQPMQVTELIHQLAASIGCHIYIQPRNDFGSWRQWKEPSAEERLHLNGFPPFAQSFEHREGLGMHKQHGENPELPNKIAAKELQHESPVATEKTVKRRSTKRTAKTA
jgi:hypothetical protein